MSENVNGISKADLKEILTAVAALNAENQRELIAELKKPTVLEQKELDAEAQRLRDANEDRKTNSAGVLHQMKQKRVSQEICSHKHPSAHGGQSHGVHVTEQGNPYGYILCQKCQVKIRPGKAPEGYQGLDVYDTRAFNLILQDLPSNRLFE
jgi:hypothetical protein